MDIDGMEWAAEQGADILHLCVGQPGNYTDGTDPASSTGSTGARVAPAGNEGPQPGTIPTLGAASSALTVAAAVRDDDRVAGFSSAGPAAVSGCPKVTLSSASG